MSATPGPGPRLARSLAAPAPGWTAEADAIVVGSGIAGLTAALELRTHVPRVLLVTKGRLPSGSTVWAQGGIAAALDPSDSPEAHLADTLAAGGGLSDPEAVQVLVTEGPARVRELVARGAVFDKAADGDIALTREGGHHADRIAHAGGDATGAEISRALVAQIEAVRHDPGIEVMENALVLDVLTTEPDAAGARRACGVTLHVRGRARGTASAPCWRPPSCWRRAGSGRCSGRRPTRPARRETGSPPRSGPGPCWATWSSCSSTRRSCGWGRAPRASCPLISEAVRGEGALLLDVNGRRFMPAVHEMAELAPRDVVAHAIVRQMAATGADNVLLDARHLGREFLATRFPTISRRLLEAGIDWSEEPVPVAPAQHYHSGGVVTDLDGRSSVDGLYAVGEVACTGVHGANRLASNSLLEGIVFASRAARDVAARFDAGELKPGEPAERPGGSALVAAAARSRIQKVTSGGSGVIRSARSLAEVDERLSAVRADAHLAAEVMAEPQAAEWETTNVHQVARALTRAAWLREETRGGHYRTDFPKPEEAWKRRLKVWLDDDGVLTAE